MVGNEGLAVRLSRAGRAAALRVCIVHPLNRHAGFVVNWGWLVKGKLGARRHEVLSIGQASPWLVELDAGASLMQYPHAERRNERQPLSGQPDLVRFGIAPYANCALAARPGLWEASWPLPAYSARANLDDAGAGEWLSPGRRE